MKPATYLVIIGLVLILVGGITYVFRGRLNKKPAGLIVETVPPATVFLNGQEVGSTPYKSEALTSGTYTIRLVPQSAGVDLQPWETTLDLTPMVTTTINRSFTAVETDSAGSVLQFVKESGDKTYLSIISDPDTVNLNIDNKPSGYTPLTKVETTPGSHTITLSSPGYKPQELKVNTLNGYNLILNVKLAADTIVFETPPSVGSSNTATSSASPLASASPSASPLVSDSAKIEKPYVLVQETGTGWLRVRQDPSATGSELGKANTGEKLKYLGESTETGWYKIEFEGSPGWVSGKYVELVK